MNGNKVILHICHGSGSFINGNEIIFHICHAGLRNMSQRGWAPNPWLSNSGRERNVVVAIGMGGQYVAVLFGLQLPLTHNTFYKVLFTNPSARAGYDTRSIF